MMSLEGFAIWTLCMSMVAYYLIVKHGGKEYEKGIIDGINMYDSGRLEYEAYYEGEQKFIKIDIKAEDEE
jgi:hypothetical protein